MSLSHHLCGAAAFAAGALVLAGTAQAASIIAAAPTFAPTTELITFDGYDGLTFTFADFPNGLYLDDDGDVLLTTFDGGATIGAFAQDLEGNGLWGARVVSTPTGSGNFLAATSGLYFNFGADGPQARVGAFFNLTQPLSGPKDNRITLFALDANFNVLESLQFTVDTDFESYNEGVFAGFERASADIYNFQVFANPGATLVMDNLHLSITPVPEPATYALLMGGLGVVGWMSRRRQQAC